jgi:hypothetical protein
VATIKQLYGTSAQAITCTITTLASSATACRASTAVDNTTNLYLDALVQVNVTLGATATANDKCVYVWAYGTADGGTTYTDGVTGTDAAFTRTDPPNLKLIGVLNTPTASTAYKSGPMSVAAAFGGVLPDHWGVVVQNYSGSAFTAGAVVYQGVQGQTV